MSVIKYPMPGIEKASDINAIIQQQLEATHFDSIIRSPVYMKRFGRLIATRPTRYSSGGNRFWECKCDCGGTIYVSTYLLTHGQISHCAECDESITYHCQSFSLQAS